MIIYRAVNKGDNITVAYPYFDTQRIRETFFDSPPPASSPKKRYFPLAISGAAFICLSLFLLARFQFICIPRDTRITDTAQSLLRAQAGTSVTILPNAVSRVKKVHSAVYAAIPRDGKTGFMIRFDTPRDLQKQSVRVWIKKSSEPVIMEAVIRDSNYFSNAQNPLRIELPPTETELYPLGAVPLLLRHDDTPKIRLSRIKEIKLYFSRRDTSSEQPIEYRHEPWILVQDVTLENNAE